MTTRKKGAATRSETLDGILLGEGAGRATLEHLIETEQLYDMAGAARAAGRCVRYLRRLCAAKAIDHHRLLGRYYMTPDEVARMLQPIKAKE